jgi:hypothetical protein
MSKTVVSTHQDNQDILDRALISLDSKEPEIQKATTIAKIVDVKFRGYRDQVKYKSLRADSSKMPFYEE